MLGLVPAGHEWSTQSCCCSPAAPAAVAAAAAVAPAYKHTAPVIINIHKTENN
jgi:hypothetical protein